jgi:hypothetical protein
MADDSNSLPAPEGLDEALSFAAARTRALVLALDATPAQRLAWLEEAIEIAYASGALPKRSATRW